MQNDVINSAGNTSSSTHYNLTDNFGESVTGPSSSASYKLNAGFIQADQSTLSFSVTPNSINLGVLSTGSISSGEAYLTTTTSYAGGYFVKAYDNTEPGIANGLIDGTNKIADATTPNNYIDNPSAGTEHYGVSITGTHAAAGYASGTKINSLDNTTWIDVSSYNGAISDDEQTATFKASIDNLTPPASHYSAITTFICTANF